MSANWSISQHLALLRQVELVRTERSGLNIFYRVNATRLAEALQALHPFLPLTNDDLVTTIYQGGKK